MPPAKKWSHYTLRRQYTKLLSHTVVALLLLGLFMLIGLPKSHAKTIRIAAAGGAQSVDPHTFNDSTNNALLRSIYEPLVDYDSQTFKIKGVVAQKWRFVSSTVLEFSIKPNVYFHDGSKLTANDVAFSLNRAAHPTSTFQTYTMGIREVRVKSPMVVEIVLTKPNPVILNQLTELLIVNQAWIKKNHTLTPEKLTADTSALLTKANGTGPYILKSWGAGQQITLVTNPNWWGKLPRRSPLQIEYFAIADENARLRRLLDGDLDLVFDPPIAKLRTIRSTPGLTTLQAVDNRVIFIGMDQQRQELLYGNIKGKNPLASPLVRQALNLAIDIESIKRNVMNDQIEPRGSILAPLVTGWSASADKRPPHNISLAKQLLTQAGYPRGFQTQLLCPNNRYLNDEALCQALASMWKKIGVEVHVDAKPIAQVIPEIRASNYSLFLLGWASPTFDAHYSLTAVLRRPISAEQPGLNGTGYRNKTVDGLIDTIATEMNVARRQALIQQVLDVAKKEAAILPLYNQVAHWAHSRKLSLKRRSDMRPDWTNIEVLED